MPEPFVDILANKLSSDSGEVSELLEDYVSSLRRRIRSGESVHIDSFGEFSAQGGQIRFTPNPALSALVNYRYEGLDAYPSGTWLGLSSAAELAEPETSEPVLEEPRREPLLNAEPTVEAAETRGVRWTYVLIPVIVLAAAALTFFVLRSGTLRPDTETSGRSDFARAEAGIPSGASGLEPGANADRTASIVPVDSSRSGTAPQNNEQQTLDAAAGGETGAPVGSVIKEPDTEPDFARRFTRDTTGYTLVVGRAGTLEAAVDRIQRFTSLGLPLAVVEYEDSGVFGYRLAVGHFSTLDDARRGLNDHADRLPDGTWIRRIRLLFSN